MIIFACAIAAITIFCVLLTHWLDARFNPRCEGFSLRRTP